MLLWLPNGSFFWKNVAVAQVLGGVPLQFVHSGTIIWTCSENPCRLLIILWGPEGPRGESIRVDGAIYLSVGAQPRAFFQQIQGPGDQRTHIPREV